MSKTKKQEPLHQELLLEALNQKQREQSAKVVIDTFFQIFPPSVNTIWTQARGRTILSARGRHWYDTMEKLVLEKKLKKEIPETMIKEPCEVVLFLYPANVRTHDVDNYSKGILDAMTKNGIWEDDSLVYRLTIEKFHKITGGAFRIKIMV